MFVTLLNLHPLSKKLILLSSFVNHLDPMLIEALSSTASVTQANALKDLFYRHLMGEGSIGVYIPVSLLSKGRKFTLFNANPII